MHGPWNITEGWDWPKGYGPHDTLFFAGSYGSPTDTDLSIYLDFWKSGDTFVRSRRPNSADWNGA